MSYDYDDDGLAPSEPEKQEGYERREFVQKLLRCFCTRLNGEQIMDTADIRYARYSEVEKERILQSPAMVWLNNDADISEILLESLLRVLRPYPEVVYFCSDAFIEKANSYMHCNDKYKESDVFKATQLACCLSNIFSYICDARGEVAGDGLLCAETDFIKNFAGMDLSMINSIGVKWNSVLERKASYGNLKPETEKLKAVMHEASVTTTVPLYSKEIALTICSIEAPEVLRYEKTKKASEQLVDESKPMSDTINNVGKPKGATMLDMIRNCQR